jgi:hypothetical protein|tara:strand:- start:2599 stop:6294 length:3696 start_codon:yes stop_codon:yes gene_type:complete
MSLDKTLTDIYRRDIKFDRYEVETVLPEHYLERYPKLVAFLKAYYKSLEDSSNPVSDIKDLMVARDIVQTREEFLSYISNELLLGKPYFESFNDKRSALQYSSLLYRSKGTEFSIKQFFRIFFGVDIEVGYGRDEMFIVGEPTAETVEYTGSGSISDSDFDLTFPNGTVEVTTPYVDPTDSLTKYAQLIEGVHFSIDYANNKVVLLVHEDPALGVVNTQTGVLPDGVTIRIQTNLSTFTSIGADVTDKRITDNKFYQLYGLLVSTPLSVNLWQEAYKTFVHPAGMYLAGQVALSSTYLMIRDIPLAQRAIWQISSGLGAMPDAIIQPPPPILLESTARVMLAQNNLGLHSTSYAEIGPGPNGYKVLSRINDQFKPQTVANWHTQYENMADADDINARTMDETYIDMSNIINLMDEDVWHYDYVHPIENVPIYGYNDPFTGGDGSEGGQPPESHTGSGTVVSTDSTIDITATLTVSGLLSRSEFIDPDTAIASPMWRMTNNAVVRDYHNYHNTQSWSHDGQYLLADRWTDGSSGGGRQVRLLDLANDSDQFVAFGADPRWGKTDNTLFFIEYTSTGGQKYDTSSNSGVAVKRYTVATDTIETIGYGIENLGETSANDSHIYGVQRYRDWDDINVHNPILSGEYKSVRLENDGTVNIPTQLGDGSGKRPLPNPDVNRPVVMMRNKTAGENETTAPFGQSRSWSDLDGGNIRKATTFLGDGHQCWSGDGMWHLIGNQQLVGRKWDEPWPSNMERLANSRVSDPGACGKSGRWIFSDGKILDLRTGATKSVPASRTRLIYPILDANGNTQGDQSEPWDYDGKGSPDGTKVAFVSNFDIENGHSTRLTTNVGSSTSTSPLNVSSTAGFPTSGYIASPSGEVIGYTGITSTTFTGITRGALGTMPRGIDKDKIITDLESRLIPPALRGTGTQPNWMSATKFPDGTGAEPDSGDLIHQRQTDLFVSVVRLPDSPYLRIEGGSIELIPGENHYETKGYEIFKDNVPIGSALSISGTTVSVGDAGTYTARAVEHSGLKGRISNQLIVTTTSNSIDVLSAKPANFDWTYKLWSSPDGNTEAIVTDTATASGSSSTVHLGEVANIYGLFAIMHQDVYANGLITERHFYQSNANPPPTMTAPITRKIYYNTSGFRIKQEYYRDNLMVSEEIFNGDTAGIKTEETLWDIDANTGLRDLNRKWYYDDGTGGTESWRTGTYAAGHPVRLEADGDVYLFDGTDWVEQ